MDQSEARPPLATYQDLAGRFDHRALDPTLSDEDIAKACRLAIQCGASGLCVRPSDIELAARLLGGSSVAPIGAVGFPHGSDTTAVKLYAARDLLRRGAKEIEVAVNIGKLISRQFQYIEIEILQISRACHESGALLSVFLENALLSEDLKVIALKICKRCEADYAGAASTCADADLLLMRRVLKDVCKIKVAGGVGSLDAALAAYALGADRLGSIQTPEILADWKARLASESQINQT